MSGEEFLEDDEAESSEPEALLLQAARTGNAHIIQGLLEAVKEKRISLDIDCKGAQKSNSGWTPLHLSCYFGHLRVAKLLLEHGANIDVVNNDGDTPLHKASYTGREDIVLLLLTNNASVMIKNGTGQTPKNVAKNNDIRNLLHAAEESDTRRKEELLFTAVREGDLNTVKALLTEAGGCCNINCVDMSGNTALHCAAYRGRKEMAIALLQMGIDTHIRNSNGQQAIDLASNPQMKQILAVQPIRHLQKNAARVEGALLRKTRFLGWKPVWAVLERGVLSFFQSRGDAATGSKRKDYKYLDAATIVPNEQNPAVFLIRFSDNSSQTFSVRSINCQEEDRQKWISALDEHVAFSSHYVQPASVDSDSEDDIASKIPLSTMQDALKTAQAHQKLLQGQVESVSATLHGMVNTIVATEPPSSSNNNIKEQNRTNQWLNLIIQLNGLVDYSSKMSTSLGHCMDIFAQQEEVRKLALKQEQERSRILQESLQALAKEHLSLERSVGAFSSARKRRSMDDTDCDEFFDASDGDEDEDTLVGTDDFPNEASVSLLTSLETEPFVTLSSDHLPTDIIGEDGTLTSAWGRVKLPVPMFSRNDFSMWSILKQCIGKELSKITMPVVFNEPLSLLQRIAEYMEYCHLLIEADKCSDPVDRIELVAAFATSASASNWERIGKPFNPLLGETYELRRDEVGFRLVCEQVSHHPPVSAFHAESDHFVFYGSVYPKLKFWGKSIEVVPEGVVTVQLRSHNEVYTWNNVTCCIHNIIVGKLWLEQYGQMEVVCHSSSLKAVLNFKQSGWFGKDLHRIEGYIYDKQKKKLRFIYGKWTDYLKSADVASAEEYLKSHPHKSRSARNQSKESETPSSSPAHGTRKIASKLNNLTRQLTGGGSSSGASSNNSVDATGPAENESTEVPKSDSAYSLDIPNSQELWRAIPRPDYSPEYYHFTLFAMALNEEEPEMESFLPRTDSRLRPDIRKLDGGDLDRAAFEKNRLEEKQRDARKLRKKQKQVWEPLWFSHEKHQYVKDDAWIFNQDYWKRNYTESPNIF